MFWLSPLGALRGRRGWVLGALSLLPMVVVFAGMMYGRSDVKALQGFVDTAASFYFQKINLLVCLFLGCAAIGEEVDGRTLPYLLTRAIPRSALILGRFLSYFASAGLLLGTCILLLYLSVVGQMGQEALLLDLPYLGATLLGLALAVVAYGSLFLMLSVTVKRPLFVGLGLIFLWESWAVTGPSTIPHYTVQHYVYALLSYWTELPAFAQHAQAATLAELAELTSRQKASWTLAAIVVVPLLFAIYRFRRKEYVF